MAIAYKPRESGDQEVSDLLTKVAMFIVDQNKFPWKESQIFADGLIQQRGYFDIRMEFDENMNGDVSITTLDPMDVIPDPDGKEYDPKSWADVTTTKWITLDSIKTTYGLAVWRRVSQMIDDEPDFGSDGYGEPRNKFSAQDTYSSYYKDKADVEHVRVIERQWKKLNNRFFWYDISTGEMFPVPDGTTKREMNQVAKDGDYEVISRLVERIRWTTSTKNTILHDDWSPYDHYTIVPFFPYFRRGRTVGMVDNLIKTQEMLNKVFSQTLHVVNTTANSGWTLEQNSLTNMETEDLEDRGGETGLVLEYKPGRGEPKKIEPNQIPNGLKDLTTTGVELIRLISGVSETFQGGGGPEVSGVAIQSRVHQAAVQLATPIDNLFRTRNMVAEILLDLIQNFYTDERAFLITSDQEVDESGQPQQQPITINNEGLDSQILNDITVGKYDVVIADVPTHITFQNAQMQEALEMRKFGVEIPDEEMIMLSTLSRKSKIVEKMSNDAGADQQQAQIQAQMEELQAKVDKMETDEIKNLAEVAQMIAENPDVGPILDGLIAGQEKEEMQDQQPQQPIPEQNNELLSQGVV